MLHFFQQYYQHQWQLHLSHQHLEAINFVYGNNVFFHSENIYFKNFSQILTTQEAAMLGIHHHWILKKHQHLQMKRHQEGGVRSTLSESMRNLEGKNQEIRVNSRIYCRLLCKGVSFPFKIKSTNTVNFVFLAAFYISRFVFFFLRNRFLYFCWTCFLFKSKDPFWWKTAAIFHNTINIKS